MLRFIRALQNHNQGCCALQNVPPLILHRPGIVYFSTEVKEKLETKSKITKEKNDKLDFLFEAIGHKNPTPHTPNVKIDNEYSTKTSAILANMLSANEYVKFIESASPSGAAQILQFLARQKFKSPYVCKAVSSKICNAPKGALTLKECSDILYSSAVLSYKEEEFITKVASEILNFPLEANERHLTPLIIRSLGSLKYKDNELIEVLIKNILEFPSPNRTKDLLTSLMTLSILNFRSPYVGILMKELGNLQSSNFFGTKEYLNFVWSSVILNELDVKHISAVLSKSYIDALRTFGGVHGTSEAINLKLQNINAAATVLIPGYTNPVLSETFSRPLNSQSKSRFLALAVDGLCHIFPKNGYLKTYKDIKTGFLVDVEFKIDSRGAPVPLHKSEGVKVALILLDFNDFCLGKEKNLTGINAFKQRILEGMGYKVINLPYTEYNDTLTLAKKVEYLNQKITQIFVK